MANKRISEFENNPNPSLDDTLICNHEGTTYKMSVSAITSLVSGNTGNSDINTLSYPKDETITEEHIGLLAMQKLIVTGDGNSISDFNTVAQLCNTVPAEEGTRGEYSLEVNGMVLKQPVTKIVRIEFLQNIRLNHYLEFAVGESQTIIRFKPSGEATASLNEIELGANLEQTILNIISFFANAQTTLTTNYMRVEGSNYDSEAVIGYIDFELLYGENDDIKYIDNSFLTAWSDAYINGLNYVAGGTNEFTDAYGEIMGVTSDVSPNIDGYYPVLNIGGGTNTLTSQIFVDVSGSLYTDTDSMGSLIYTPIDNYSRDADGSLRLFVGSSIDRGYFPNIFIPFMDVGEAMSTVTQRELDVSAANTALGVYNQANSEQSLVNYYGPETNMTVTLLSYDALFLNQDGQPNGTSGAFGLKYFADSDEVLAALLWALSNTSGGYFDTYFTVLSTNIIDGNGNVSVIFEQKNAPTSSGSNYFNTNGANGIAATVQTNSSPVSGNPERINSIVLGRIAGIDGDNVLIDKSYSFEVTMCSAEDGALGALPYSPELFGNNFIPFICAWRNGKVIDFFGYYEEMVRQGFAGDSILIYPIIVGGAFRVLNIGLPDTTFKVDRGVITNFN